MVFLPCHIYIQYYCHVYMWILSYPILQCGSSEMQNRVLEIIPLIIQDIEDNRSFSWLWGLMVYIYILYAYVYIYINKPVCLYIYIYIDECMNMWCMPWKCFQITCHYSLSIQWGSFRHGHDDGELGKPTRIPRKKVSVAAKKKEMQKLHPHISIVYGIPCLTVLLVGHNQHHQTHICIVYGCLWYTVFCWS